MFLDEIVGMDTAVMNLVKCVNQAMIAPVEMKLKLMFMEHKMNFKDVMASRPGSSASSTAPTMKRAAASAMGITNQAPSTTGSSFPGVSWSPSQHVCSASFLLPGALARRKPDSMVDTVRTLR